MNKPDSASGAAAPAAVPGAADLSRALHELQVHQAELAQQNEELQAARSELAGSLARHVALYDEAPVGLVTVDRRGIVLDVNGRGQDLLRRRRAALVGRSVLACLTPATRDALRVALAAPPGGTLHVEFAVPAEDEDAAASSANPGERALHADIQPSTPAALGAGRVLLALTDITARRQAEADLALTRAAPGAQLAFLSRVSQELRTPLNAVLGFSYLLGRAPALQGLPQALAQVRHINDAGKQLLAMVEDLIDLSRIETGELRLTCRSLELGPIAAECMRFVEVLSQPRGVTLQLEGAADGHRVLADHSRLCQALTNLLHNAVSYNREGGEVRLRIDQEGEQVAVAIHDTGPGLAPEQLARLFEPWGRLGPAPGGAAGTGLGLVIARHLVTAMQGSLEVRSELGAGSVFTVRLPRAGHLAAAAA